jgi:hypothetical protein
MGQRHWFFCNNCHGLFFHTEGNSKGVCPKGGEHDNTGSFEFDLPNGGAETDTAQEGWRFCPKCSGIFWEKAFDASVCPKGGGHEPQGFNFVLNHNVPGEQPNWLFCEKCHGLFFSRAPSPGVCPKDHKDHNPAPNSFDFVLTPLPP